MTDDLLNVVCERVCCEIPDCPNHGGLEPSDVEQVLDEIPDGWAKVDGQWVRLVQCGTDFNVSENTDDWPIYRTEPRWRA